MGGERRENTEWEKREKGERGRGEGVKRNIIEHNRLMYMYMYNYATHKLKEMIIE